MNKRQARRLLNVARSLRESVVPEAFTMKCFIRGDYLEAQCSVLSINAQITKKRNWCGTPACAIGHYSARRDLQRLLKISSERRGVYKVVNGVSSSAIETFPLIRFDSRDWDRADDLAFCDERFLKHFGITHEQAIQLFAENGCNGAKRPGTAAKYIETFVAKHYGTM